MTEAELRLLARPGADPHPATPAGPGPWPGVIVIHDALGMNQLPA